MGASYRLRLLALIASVCLVVALLAATASGRSGRATAPVLSFHPSFHRAGHAIGLILSDGRYVYRDTSVTHRGVLLDERTGVQRTVSRPDCAAGSIGGGWLLFQCGGSTPRLMLYRIKSRQWRSLRQVAVGYAEAIGNDWIDFVNDGPGCPEEGPCDAVVTHEFQNIRTGKVIDYTEEKTQIPNLDSPALIHHLCTPLTTMLTAGLGGEARVSPLVLYGQFVLITYDVPSDSGINPVTYLERCDTHRRQRIPTTYTTGALLQAAVTTPTNPNIVIWPTGAHQLTGIFLPSLRRFTIAVPARIGRVMATVGTVDFITLTRRTLYVQDGTQLWSTAAPDLHGESLRLLQ